MGKTTLYHPISLHVIRGAAEFCGWKFGRIEQIRSESESGYAEYVAQIEIVPTRVDGSSFKAMLSDLAACFMQDIRPSWIRMTKGGKWVVDLYVDISEGAPEQDAMEMEAADHEGS